MIEAKKIEEEPEPNPPQAQHRVMTRFGEFEADLRNVIEFPQGLPGFEECRRFVVVTSPEAAPLQCLHAVDGPPATFLAIDPRIVLPQYRSVLTSNDRARLGASDETPLLWLAIVTIDKDETATANLRAPVVINPARMIGFQMVPQDSLYPLRWPLAL